MLLLGPGPSPRAGAEEPAASAREDEETPWEEVAVENGRIAIPRGWRAMDFLKPPVYRVGDGMGTVPVVDETGEPLQVGINVERFPEMSISLERAIDGLIEDAKAGGRLQLVQHEVEELELADGTAARLLTTQFIKEKTRLSLQMKLVVKDAEATVWVVNGYVVGGRESTWPTPESRLTRWVEAHLKSFTLDGEKFDTEGLRAAYEP
jgi:hypothetical protein